MRTDDFNYDLPPELIAQHPAERRDQARMMVLDRAAQTWAHRCVSDLPDYLRPHDLLVLNNTRVIPARIFGHKPSGGRVEFLFLEETEPDTWLVLMRASRRPKPGTQVMLGQHGAAVEILEEGEFGRAKVRVISDQPFLHILEQDGIAPLPPYISRDYSSEQDTPEDRARYQTIYASQPGAVAAPTAGLHFTPELLDQLAARGVELTEVTLPVGIGTFRPVSVDRVEDHVMDEERYEITEAAAQAIESTRKHGGRITAVGSTSVRTLETVAARPEGFGAGTGRSALFITPPYPFRLVDVMLTNFHLPKSTLLMMVCALAGREFMLEAYREAVRNKYRFFSYGDCMLIL
ncbi:MAG: tRNA preQ1(34) S-adenosylmethionine ribosyltransferase-isomerase QueA [Kiritimatiellae bacterium]|nr:tRNA preQ1(34) S-adenosylmethionine ribosyltransferase-isomerase QueA [Kiritimatiellia bacterium]